MHFQEVVAEMTVHLEDARSELLAKMEKSKPFLNLRSVRPMYVCVCVAACPSPRTRHVFFLHLQMLNKKNVIVRQLREQLRANGIAADDDVAAVDD